MELEEGFKRINGVMQVEIEGFFTERFINLCKINNVKIWNIKTVFTGIVRFNITIKDFKKLKKIAKKTRCKVKIISKKGLYFKMFKLRKRKLGVFLFILFLAISIFSTTFIWKVDIVGNTYIKSDEIYSALKDAGLYVGRNKKGLKTKDIINKLRVNVLDIAWVGIDIDGTHAVVNIVEKTRLAPENRIENKVGDVISNKSGIIEKMVVENGTPILSVGDYVEEGRILIEGKMYSEHLGIQDVTAKGIIYLKTNYKFKKEYPYKSLKKNYTKDKYTIGITINDRENYINYLDKSLKYDIIKNSSDITLFGNTISLDWLTLKLYQEEEITHTKDELIEVSKQDAASYINELLPTLNEATLINQECYIEECEDKIITEYDFQVVEKVGYFKERIKYE